MIGYEDYKGNTVDILNAFLWYGKPIYKDKRKLEGYGLKMDDFLHKFKNGNDKSYSSATKRMFVPRKNDLLSNRFITQIRSKGKQTKYYSITPIGIAYLCQQIKLYFGIVPDLYDLIIKHLIFYHETTKPKLGYSKLLKDHSRIFQKQGINLVKKQIIPSSIILEIMEHVKISYYRHNETGVELSYPLSVGAKIRYGEYLFTHKPISKTSKIIDGKKVNVFTINPKNITDEFLEIHLPSQKNENNKIGDVANQFTETTEKEIYQKISTFIIKAFFYESITNRIQRMYWNTSKGKKIRFKKEFKSIPKEYLTIAEDFLNELNSILELNVIELGKIKKIYSDQLLSNVS